MTNFFLILFNRSMAAGWLILVILILRLLLKKTPKTLTCMLWGLAAIRLICPLSLESPLSLLPSAEVLSLYEVQFSPEPSINSGIPALDDALNPVIGQAFAPDPAASVNPLYIWTALASLVWAAGVICLLLYALFCLWRLRRRVREAIPYQESVWICDAVQSPFLLGMIRPRIYLPSDLNEPELHFVLAHEQAHIRRKDHWWKALGYLLLTVYWFHPLLWIAYGLFCRDLELACDETVIRDMDLSEKKAYSHALLSFSTRKQMVLTCPLAFSEGRVKTRVTHILNYRKPAFWIAAAALFLCAITAVCLLTDPVLKPDQTADTPSSEHAPSSEETLPVPSETYQPEPASDSEKPLISETSASLEEAIAQAILTQNLPANPKQDALTCCDFAMLEHTFYSPVSETAADIVTCYGWALYQEYEISEHGIVDIGGSHLPVALTFEIDENGYHLTEYWVPRDGSYFNQDVRERFPAHIADDGINSQKYILAQIQSCYRQAIQKSGMDTEPVLRQLLTAIASSPAVSSNPQDYIEAHPMEYRELLYYGAYTLRYCFDRFQQGGETGLEGQIMALACEELLQTKGTIPADAASSATGQFWYDTLYAHASNRVDPYLSSSELADMDDTL